MLNNNQFNEIIEIIGSGWLLLSISESKIFFEIYPIRKEIAITINNELGPNTYESYEAGKFEILSCNNNIIEEVKLLVNKSAERILKEYLFSKKNEILDYYRQNIVL